MQHGRDAGRNNGGEKHRAPPPPPFDPNGNDLLQEPPECISRGSPKTESQAVTNDLTLEIGSFFRYSGNAAARMTRERKDEKERRENESKEIETERERALFILRSRKISPQVRQN